MKYFYNPIFILFYFFFFSFQSFGGGLCFSGPGTFSIINSNFENCSCINGGGGAIASSSTSGTFREIINIAFTGNSAFKNQVYL
jgi:hypothetical protein